MRDESGAINVSPFIWETREAGSLGDAFVELLGFATNDPEFVTLFQAFADWIYQRQ